MTLGAQKLRQFRTQHHPALTKVKFGLRYGVTGACVGNWEGGRVPESRFIQRLFDDGIAEPNDWFVPPLPPELLRAVPAHAGRCRHCRQSLFSTAALAGPCCDPARQAAA